LDRKSSSSAKCRSRIETSLILALVVAAIFLLSSSFLLIGSARTANVPIDVKKPRVVSNYLSGSYSNPAPPIGQINVVDRGATVVGWSLVGLDLSGIHHITVSFEIMTDVLTPGPYGGRVTTAFGFTNSTTLVCCYTDLSANLTKGTASAFVSNDLGLAGPRLLFQSDLITNPDAANSGDRVSIFFQKDFPNYVADRVFHTYSIGMNFTSQVTTWSVDGGSALASHAGFVFVPTSLMFYTRGMDSGNSVIAQVRNIVVQADPASQGVNQTPYQSSLPYPWWFWATIVGLSGLSAVLLVTNITSRFQRTTGGRSLAKRERNCPKCGESMPQGSAFCGRCGLKLVEAN